MTSVNRLTRITAFVLPIILATAALATPLNTDPLTGEAYEAADRAYKAIAAKDYAAAIRHARDARQAAPDAEAPVRVLIDALSQAGQKKEALVEAEKAIAQGNASGQLYAQRGFLRQGSGDLRGALTDFRAAIAKDQLAAGQEHTLTKTIAQVSYDLTIKDAEAARKHKQHARAASLARQAMALKRGEEYPLRILVDALSAANQRPQALAEATRFIKAHGGSGQLYAQRGFLYQQSRNTAAASADFRAALKSGSLSPAERQTVNTALFQIGIAAAIAEKDYSRAEALIRKSGAQAADNWFSLAAALKNAGQRHEALRIYEEGLQITPRGSMLLEAGYLALESNAARSSALFRAAIDRWNAGDPTLASRSARDKEALRNQIVEADQSIKTTLTAGGILGRPLAGGGTKLEGGIESVVRFDGRYLPYVAGLEAYGSLAYSHEQPDYSEGGFAAGLRWRPFKDINFAVSAGLQSLAWPQLRTRAVLSWGYSAGGIDYPYEEGLKPYWQASTFGTLYWPDARYLQDSSIALGFAYSSRDPVRSVIAPAVMLSTSLDTQASPQFAAAIGPSLTYRIWLGGDTYRSYDTMATFQLGYMMPLGASHRLQGLAFKASFQF